MYFFSKKAITIRTTKPSVDTEKSGAGSSGGGAKPISYDTYSTDTSSQFSVDIVEVAPRGLEMENKNEVQIENGPQTDGDGIVLNASKLQVETEKWILNTYLNYVLLLHYKIKDWFDQDHNPSHSTLYPDVLKIKTIIFVFFFKCHLFVIN